MQDKASKVQWSDFRDWQAGHATAHEAIEGSQHREAFMAALAAFTAKANRHEQVSVFWWHAPYIYIEATDSRKDGDTSARALVSFDLTNGKLASHDSKRRYAFARRGWHSFVTRLVGYYVTLYGEAGMPGARS